MPLGRAADKAFAFPAPVPQFSAAPAPPLLRQSLRSGPSFFLLLQLPLPLDSPLHLCQEPQRLSQSKNYRPGFVQKRKSENKQKGLVTRPLPSWHKLQIRSAKSRSFTKPKHRRPKRKPLQQRLQPSTSMSRRSCRCNRSIKPSRPK